MLPVSVTKDVLLLPRLGGAVGGEDSSCSKPLNDYSKLECKNAKMESWTERVSAEANESSVSLSGVIWTWPTIYPCPRNAR
jgi:hypothetical protein